MTRAAVLGAGAWGTTFASVLADAGNHVVLWGRDEQTVAQINDEHRNEKALPGLRVAPGVRATTDVALDEEAGRQLLKFLDVLEDLDDTQNVYSNADIPDEAYEDHG